MLQDGIEENLQLCVYVDEKCVVDLYGTAVGDSTYNCDTISVSNAGYNRKLGRIQMVKKHGHKRCTPFRSTLIKYPISIIWVLLY